MIRECVDFHLIPASQEAIHQRLLNWARWLYGSKGSDVAPMFKYYRSTDQWADNSTSVPVDSLDAHKIERAVAALPEKHGPAIRWHYTKPCMGPQRFARNLGITQPELANLVIEARNILAKRKA